MKALLFVISLLLLSQQASANEWIYSFRPGDTLWGLCEKYIATPSCWKKIAQRNRIADPKNIKLGTRIYLPVAWLNVAPVSAKVLSVYGDVKLIRPEAKTTQALDQDTKIAVGDQIVTNNGSVTLQFADESILVITQDSEVEFDTLSMFGETGMVDTRVRLNRGRAKARVKPRSGPASRYEIVTPAAIAAVRGTEFRVSTTATEPPQMRTEVLEGKVWVNNASSEQIVSAGYALSAVSGQDIAAPTRLLTAPLLVGNEASGQKISRFPWLLQWQPVTGASSYHLRLYKKGLIFNRLLKDTQVVKPQFEFKSLAEGDYLVELTAVDAQGFEGLEGAYLVTAEKPVPIEPIAISSQREKQQGDDGNIVWRWTAVEGAEHYKLLVSINYPDKPTETKTLEVERNQYVQPVSGPGVYNLQVAPVVAKQQLSYTEKSTVDVAAEKNAPVWLKILVSTIFFALVL